MESGALTVLFSLLAFFSGDLAVAKCIAGKMDSFVHYRYFRISTIAVTREVVDLVVLRVERFSFGRQNIARIANAVRVTN